MGVETQRFVRKPLFVEAVRVTVQNFDAVAAWCEGEITKEVRGSGAPKPCIKVQVQFPKNPRQTQAFVGDWVLSTERGFKVYTNKAFKLAFDPAEYNDAEVIANQQKGREEREQEQPATTEQIKEGLPHAQDKRPQAPPQDEVRTLHDVKPESITIVAEEPDPTGTGVQPIESVAPVIDESSAGLEEVVEESPLAGLADAINTAEVERERPDGLPTHTPQGEEIEYVEATPQAIADAVSGEQPIAEFVDESEKARSENTGIGGGITPEYPEDHTIGGTPREEINVQEPPSPEAVSEQTPEDAAAGKRVLSDDEQRQMGPDAVREMVRTGDVILVQDLA